MNTTVLSCPDNTYYSGGEGRAGRQEEAGNGGAGRRAGRQAEGGTGKTEAAQGTFFRTFNNEGRKQRGKNRVARCLYEHCSPTRGSGRETEEESGRKKDGEKNLLKRTRTRQGEKKKVLSSWKRKIRGLKRIHDDKYM